MLACWTQPYVDFKSRDDVKRFIERVVEARIDIIFPCIKSEPHFTEGKAFAMWQTTRMPMLYAWDTLQAMIEEAHGTQVAIHPWFSIFHEGESSFLQEHPQARCQSFDYINRQHPTHFACPAQPLVQEHQLSLIQEVLAHYDIAGVHLDFIRYPNANTCACDYCRARFKEETGFDFDQIKDSYAARLAWLEQRKGIIAKFVSQIGELVHGLNKQLSAAVFAAYPASIEMVGQDWMGWLEQNRLDLIAPMNYQQETSAFAKQALHHRLLSRQPERILQGIARTTEPVRLTPAEMLRQVQIADELGFGGSVLFAYDALKNTDIEMLAARP